MGVLSPGISAQVQEQYLRKHLNPVVKGKSSSTYTMLAAGVGWWIDFGLTLFPPSLGCLGNSSAHYSHHYELQHSQNLLGSCPVHWWNNRNEET